MVDCAFACHSKARCSSSQTPRPSMPTPKAATFLLRITRASSVRKSCASRARRILCVKTFSSFSCNSFRSFSPAASSSSGSAGGSLPRWSVEWTRVSSALLMAVCSSSRRSSKLLSTACAVSIKCLSLTSTSHATRSTRWSCSQRLASTASRRRLSPRSRRSSAASTALAQSSWLSLMPLDTALRRASRRGSVCAVDTASSTRRSRKLHSS
mmetsp:Transcript_89348/g.261236  ORF Transcript_89348/g.261236 Transcript_89348/m.261236 type:complete len:211 (-) Transcript_89348:121-753(-)